MRDALVSGVIVGLFALAGGAAGSYLAAAQIAGQTHEISRISAQGVVSEGGVRRPTGRTYCRLIGSPRHLLPREALIACRAGVTHEIRDSSSAT